MLNRMPGTRRHSHAPATGWQRSETSVFCHAGMEDFTVSLRLGGRIIGRVAARLDTKASLADAKGTTPSSVPVTYLFRMSTPAFACCPVLAARWKSNCCEICRLFDRNCAAVPWAQCGDQAFHGDIMWQNWLLASLPGTATYHW